MSNPIPVYTTANGSRVLSEPRLFGGPQIRDLAEQGYLVSLKSYLEMKDARDDLKLDMKAGRIAFKAISQRCKALQARTAALDTAPVQEQLQNALRSLRFLEGQVSELDKELAGFMCDLHSVEGLEVPSKPYEFMWGVINSVQSSVERMNPDFCLRILFGLEQLNLDAE